MPPELYISVDIESSGPIPGEYSMLSLGACVVGDTEQVFYAELKPLNRNFVPEAMEVSQFSLERLSESGIEPREVMENFARWIERTANGARPVFVGFNAGFDWSFVNYYFHKFIGTNPFGHAPIDIKSYYMGAYKTTFAATSMRQLPREIHEPEHALVHNALDDAIEQGEIFRKLLKIKG